MKKRLHILAAILWMALIWILSSIPSDKLPSLKIISIDKLAHIGIYLAWGLIINMGLIKRKARSHEVMIIYCLMLLNAALDEYHQRYIPGRSVSVYDLIANALGISLAFGYYLIRKNHDRS